MFEVKTFDEIGAAKWDKFVAKADNGSIHQMSAWKSLQETVPTRGRVLGWAVLKNGKIQAAALLTRMKTGFLSTEWYYCGRGPVFIDRKAAEFLIEAVTSELRTHKSTIFWRYDPYLLATEKALTSSSTRPASAHYHPLDTSIIDLSKSTDELLASLKKKRRYDIKQGLKNFEITHIVGAKVKDSDIDDFYSLLSSTSDSNGFTPHPKDYYGNFLKKLSPYTSLWFAERDSQRVATGILTVCHAKAVYYFAAMTDEASLRKLNPAHALLWKQIEFSQKQGAKTLDLLGIAPADDPDHPYTGITVFKNGFGGKAIQYQPGVEVVLRAPMYLAYRLAKAVR